MGYYAHPVKAVIYQVTASRAFDVEYQNTSGRPLVIFTSAVFTYTDNTKRCRLNCYVGATSPANEWVLGVGTEPLAGAGDIKCYLPVIFIVPPDYYYRIRTFQVEAPNTAIMSIWQETEL